MRLCYQHNQNEVIGVITAKGVDAVGLWFEADVLPTSTGKDVQTLLRAGALDEFSIGYYADKYHFEKRDGYAYEIRILEAITIVEVSPVTRAANEKAVILDMKNEGNEPEAENQEPEQNEEEQTQEENPINQEHNMEDIKKQLEAVEQKAAAAETALQAKETEINNLDASVKAQANEIADLRKMIQEQPKTFRKAVREALDANRETIEGFIKGTGNYTVEF
jgi:HK97 family phage prohead protease